MKKITVIITVIFITVLCLNATDLHVGPLQQYSTIQAAVNAASSGDVIIIHPSNNPYIENVNLDNPRIGYLTIKSIDPQDVNVVKNTVVEPANTNLSTFKRTTSSIPTHIYIKGLTITDGVEGLRVYDIFTPTYFYFEDCIIIRNTYGGIVSECLYPINIHRTIFKNNYYAVISTHNWEQNRSCIEIFNSLVAENTNGLVTDLDIQIQSCTIAKNSGTGISIGQGTSTIKNSIIYDNGTQISNSYGTVNITYSDIEGGFTGTGNIDQDPNFCTNDNYKYYLEEPSPCIDAGDPSSTGGDVRIDMGCYESTTDIKPLQGGGHWNWISFPRLVRPNNDPNNNCTYNAPNLLSGMLPYLSNLTLKSGDNEQDLTYNNPNWSNPNYTVISTNGYKLKLTDNDDFIVPEDGTRLDSSYVVHLNPGENWVGYWLPGSENWSDALGIDKNAFTQIKAETWTMTKTPMGWIGPSNATFDYGKGYIMYVDGDLNPNGIDFYWNISFHTGGSYKKAKAESFTYEEKPDYEVIDIASIDGGEDIEEIGAFVNGVCVGASKVEGYPVQILAYTEDANKGDGSIYFEVVSSDKSKTKRNDIAVFNPQNQTFEKGEIRVTGNGYHLIKLGSGDYQEHIVDAKLTLSNYPNPFNPITTISYSIPKEGKAKLQIFNMKGQLVKTLVDGVVKKGKYNAVWNGVDKNGKKVASGIYMYKLSTKDKTIAKKMVMLK